MTTPTTAQSNPELDRVQAIGDDSTGWRRWGPYLSDRAWGTVREDYSPDGDAWRYFTYEASRSKAYRWGEDGIAGISDRFQILRLAPAFWNGADTHLKERLFGLTPLDGNHGEDAKEYWFHVDNVPSHSFMHLRYRYPQRAFPYDDLVAENRRRAGQGPEYELLDTGVFADSRWFDIDVEYAKADPEELVLRITAVNRGPGPAPLHLLPTLWFRNTWAWDGVDHPQPVIRADRSPAGTLALVADDGPCDLDPRIPATARLGRRWLVLAASADDRLLFTDNETNGPAVYGASHSSRSPFTKDA